jgi:hypothetical protein
MSFLRHGKSFDPMLELTRRGAATVTCSQRSSASMSFQLAIPWRIARQQDPPRLPQPGRSVR